MAKKKTKTKAAAKKTSRAKTSSKRAAKAKPKPKQRKQSSTLKLTQEIIDGLAAIVAEGNFRYVARGKMEIPEGTFKSWLAHGRRDLLKREEGGARALSLQAKLVIALDKAESDIHARIIQNVMTLDGDNPASVKLQLEYLYRRYGKLYSKNPNAHDDDTGDTFKLIDPLEALGDKLAPYCD